MVARFGRFPEHAEQAMLTSGESALRPYLENDEPPAAILITSQGIQPVDDLEPQLVDDHGV